MDHDVDIGWPTDDVDDLRPIMAQLVATARPFALATLILAEGGPRRMGSQLVVAGRRRWGVLSGGCVETDIVRQGRAAVAEAAPRHLVYGRGSPFFDLRLPCGGRLEVLVERIDPTDPAILELLTAGTSRRTVRYLSNGGARCVVSAEAVVEEVWPVDRVHQPPQRLVVVGDDAFALAIARAGALQGWEVFLLGPQGQADDLLPRSVIRPLGVPYATLATLEPDYWTAVVIASHGDGDEDAVLAAALQSSAGYVGALGSQRRLPARKARILAMGVPPEGLARLRAPIGLPIGAEGPREIAVAVVAEIIAHRNGRSRPDASGPEVLP